MMVIDWILLNHKKTHHTVKRSLTGDESPES